MHFDSFCPWVKTKKDQKVFSKRRHLCLWTGKRKEKTKGVLENDDVMASHAKPGFVGQVGLFRFVVRALLRKSP